MKTFSFSDDEVRLIVEALRRMQLVAYANVIDNFSGSSSECFFKLGSLLSKFD